MLEDKIAAIWEEDGDLELLQNFFKALPQDDEIKARIKSKTLQKIALSQNNSVTGSTVSEQENKKNQKTKKLFLISGLRNQLHHKKNIFIMASAAAVVILAVSLGSSGMLMPGDSPVKLGSSQKAAEDAGFGYGKGKGIAPSAPAPDRAPEIYSAESKLMDGASMDMANTGAARNQVMLQGEAGIEEAQSMESKIIYILEASLKSDDVMASVAAVEEKIKSVGGYIAESRQNNEQDHISAYLTLRVPAAEFESFRGNLSQFGTVSNQNLFTDDVSLEYFDVETRLRSWEAQEKRYLEILQQAKTVEEILRIEESLANVRREMESLKGQLKYWDNRVEYSEIRLNIYPNQSNLSVNDPWQPVSLQSTLNAAKNAVVKTISFLWNSLNYVVVFIGYALPVAVILGALWLIYRKIRKSKEGQ